MNHHLESFHTPLFGRSCRSSTQPSIHGNKVDKASGSIHIFIIDLLIIFTSHLACFIYYRGVAGISVEILALSIPLGLTWYLIALNSAVATLSVETPIFDILIKLFVAYSVLTAAMIFSVVVFGDFQPNAKLVLWPLFFSALCSGGVRLIYVLGVIYQIKKPLTKNVLLVGGDRLAEKVMKKILSKPSLGYKLMGVLADYYHPTLQKEYYLGNLTEFGRIIKSAPIDEVIIALPFRKESQIIEMVHRCESEGIRIRLVPDFVRFVSNSVVLERLDNIPLIGIRRIPLDFVPKRILKRTFDIVFSILVFLFASPVFLMIMAFVKLTSPGPVFFGQERVGINNKKFLMYKFRTMIVQDKSNSDIVWTTSGDNRVTRFGRFLRRTNLDELPQFWNVLIGDMSVVGPRPEREHFVEQFKDQILNYKVRHFVKSGITGLAQVNGYRGDTSIKSRVESDIDYLENWSFGLDITIILLTIFSKDSYDNAY